MPEVAAVGLLVVVAIVAVVLIRQRSAGPPGIMPEPAAPIEFGAETAYPDVEDEYQDGAGDQLAEALAELLVQPNYGKFVVIEGNRGYVQFTGTPAGGLYGEAVSNAFLKDDARLTESEEARILMLGWQPAGPDQNYSLTWAPPIDLHAIADLARYTLAVYGDDFDSAGIKTA